MSTSTILQTELMNLSTESKRKFPDMQPFIEQLLFQTKQASSEASLIQQLSEQPNSCQIFVMALGTKVSKIVSIGINCLHRLVSIKAIPQGAIPEILKSLQGNYDATTQLKILQIILFIVTNYNVHGQTLCDALGLVNKLQCTGGVVGNTAEAMFRQMILHTFESLTPLNENLNEVDLDQNHHDTKADALLLFKDLNLLIVEESCDFMSIKSMKQETCLELVESVLQNKTILMYSGLIDLIKLKTCPLLIKMFSEKLNFPMLIRMVRLIKALVLGYSNVLPMECEILLTLINRLEGGTWQFVLCLEFYRAALMDMQLCKNLFVVYDSKSESPNVFMDMVSIVGKTLAQMKNQLTAPSETFYISEQESTIKIQCLDHLEKTESPAYPKSYPVYLCFQSTMQIIDGLHKAIALPADNSSDTELVSVYKKMVQSIAPTLVQSVSLLLVSSVDDNIYAQVLASVSKYIALVNALQLDLARDMMITSLCYITLNQKLLYGGEKLKLEDVNICKSPPTEPDFVLTDRTMKLATTLIVAIKTVINTLDSQILYLIVFVLVTIDQVFQEGTGKREGGGSPSKDLPTKNARTFIESLGYTEKITNSYKAENLQFFDFVATIEQRSLVDVIKTLCRVAQEAITSNGGKETHEIIWSLTKLHDVSLKIVTRLFEGEEFLEFDIISMQFINVAHCVTCDVNARTFACTCFGKILVAFSQNAVFLKPKVELEIMRSIKTLMALGGNETEANVPMLTEVRRLGIDTIYKLLQASGQNMKEAWVLTLSILKTAFESSLAKTSKAAVTEEEMKDAKVDGITKIGFQCIQLVCTDFLDSLSLTALSKTIETITAVGLQSRETNISLSSIGLLWTVYDFILAKRQRLEGNDQATNYDGLTDEQILLMPVSCKSMDTLWMQLLQNLSILCSDKRPEIRNSANQTLFRTISMNGHRLPLDSWDTCISKVLFPLLEKARGVSGGKDWDDTKILNLNAVTETIINHLYALIELGEKFEGQWIQFLEYLKKSSLESSRPVAKCAMDNIKRIIDYANTEVTENVKLKFDFLYFSVFETWIAIGDEVLSTVDYFDVLSTRKMKSTVVTWSDGTIPVLTTGGVSQAVLTVYTLIINDLQPILKLKFKEQEYKKVSWILKSILLYHSKAREGATKTEIRSEFLNDMDKLSPLQENAVRFFSGSFEFVDIPGVKEMSISHLADVFVLPYIPFVKIDGNDAESGDIVYEREGVSKNTFLALSKKAFSLIESNLDSLEDRSYFYRSDSFGAVVKALDIPITYKYDSPPMSKKDPTLLWKTVATFQQKVFDETIAFLKKCDLDEEAKEKICNLMTDSLEIFFLANSKNRTKLDFEDSRDNENIDLEMFCLVKTKFLKFYSIGLKSDRNLVRVLDMINKIIANLYVSECIELIFSDVPTSKSETNVLKDTDTSETGPDVPTPTRQRLETECINTLFSVCSRDLPVEERDLNLAQRALPILLERCKLIFDRYVLDRPKYASLPMPRFRNSELKVYVSGLLDLNVITEEVVIKTDKLSVEDIRTFVYHSPETHLYKLYINFCDLLGVLTGSTHEANTNGYGDSQYADEAILTDLIRKCLYRVGKLF